MKPINPTHTVYELCLAYPELIDMLTQLGFIELSNPAMRATIGKIMTLPKAARIKSIPWTSIVDVLQQQGFVITEQ